jgi:hypothetical protein
MLMRRLQIRAGPPQTFALSSVRAASLRPFSFGCECDRHRLDASQSSGAILRVIALTVVRCFMLLLTCPY